MSRSPCFPPLPCRLPTTSCMCWTMPASLMSRLITWTSTAPMEVSSNRSPHSLAFMCHWSLHGCMLTPPCVVLVCVCCFTCASPSACSSDARSSWPRQRFCGSRRCLYVGSCLLVCQRRRRRQEQTSQRVSPHGHAHHAHLQACSARTWTRTSQLRALTTTRDEAHRHTKALGKRQSEPRPNLQPTSSSTVNSNRISCSVAPAASPIS